MVNATTNITTTTEESDGSVPVSDNGDTKGSTVKKQKADKKFKFNIHQMEERFVPEVWAIQNEAYASENFRETQNVLREKLMRYPQGFLIATEETSGEIVAYTVCHPARLDNMPLDCDSSYLLPDDSFGSLNPSDVFFINELTISPRWQGFSLGRIMFQYILALAFECTNLRRLALISVSGSHVFWNKVGGFLPVQVDDLQHMKLLENYGPYIAMTSDISNLFFNNQVPLVLSKLPDRLALIEEVQEVVVPVAEDYYSSSDEDSTVPYYMSNDNLLVPASFLQDVPV